MSYSISISGHGVRKADVERVFTEAVRELRKATPDKSETKPGWAEPSAPSGSASGSDMDGGSISLRASDVEDDDAD